MTMLYPDQPELEELAARRRRRLWLMMGGVAAVVLIAVGLGSVLGSDYSMGDPGNMTEQLFVWNDQRPALVDVTAAWGLDEWANTAITEASGGVAIGDVDGDGRADLVVAGGEATLFLGTGNGFVAVVPPLADHAVSTDLADLDGDGRLDVLVGRERGADLIVWGDTVLGDERAVTELDSGDPTTGLIAADFDGDARTDILRLGYGGGRASPDVVWMQVAHRVFEATELPGSRRRSLAAGVADLDGGGGLDVWVTRDVGWKSGGDSLYVFGVGGWVDVASEYRTDVEIDGMGVTLGDFTGDQLIDVYLSDLGDNELLRRVAEPGSPGRLQFVKDERGIGRIRPPGEVPEIVSSSWASGLADLNLDGNLDLVVVNGGFGRRDVDNKIPGTSVAASDPPALFMGFSEGSPRWADVWPDLGLEWDGAGRGLALGDLDGDLDTDIVISTRDVGLRVFRNDVEGPSMSFEVVGDCDPTGIFLPVFTDPVTLLLPLAAPTFLGRNGPEFILGLDGRDPYSLSADGPDLRSDPPGRQRRELSCSEVGRPEHS